MTLSGLQYRMLYRILSKIEKAGGNSRDKAVTIEEAKLDLEEQQWITYFAGGFLSRIKKTEDQRYYI